MRLLTAANTNPVKSFVVQQNINAFVDVSVILTRCADPRISLKLDLELDSKCLLDRIPGLDNKLGLDIKLVLDNKLGLDNKLHLDIKLMAEITWMQHGDIPMATGPVELM